MHRRLPLFLILFTLIGLPCIGKPLRTLAWDEQVAQRELVISFGERSVPIEHMHPGQRTEPIKIPKETKGLRLVDRTKTDAEGKPLGVPVPIPATVKYPLLLLVPSEKSPIGLRPLVLEDSVSSFPWGSFRILNASGRPLLATFYGKHKVPLKVSAIPAKFTPPRGSRVTMPVKIFDPGAPDRDIPVYADTWEYQPDFRQLVIIVPRKDDGNRGPLEFKFIIENKLDALPVEPETAQAP